MAKKPTYEALEQRVRELEQADMERRQAVEALRESEEIFKRFMENSPIYVFFKDKDIRSIRLSKNYEQMIGRPLQEILGKTMDELFPSDLAKSMIVDDQKVLSEGKMIVVDEEFDGRFYTTIKFPIYIDGEPRYLSGYTMDITERKAAEEALRESESQLRDRNEFILTILDNLPIGLAVNYIDKGTATYMNKRFEEIYGWPREEINEISKFFENVYPDPEYREKIKAQIAGDIKSGDPNRMQWEYVEITTKDGGKKFISAKNIPLFEQNLMISTVQDVTERKRAEAERELLQAQFDQAQKLESIGRLAGGVAHDFNNMLSVIIGNAELGMRSVSGDHPLRHFLQGILYAANRSADITRQLLAFARKQAIAPRLLDLNKTVEGMLKMLRRLIGEDIDLVWAPEAKVWPVRMDPSQINQILANLCVNARDAIADVGKITIETGMVTFDQADCAGRAWLVPGDFVLLQVSDDGCGMDKETIDKAFEPFFTTKAASKGTGLGLATVYGIIKQNGGFIEACSAPGQGATFKIYLPRDNSAAEPPRTKSLSAFNSKGKETILLVEDESSILTITKTMLEDLGYAVLAAPTPARAIGLAREHKREIHLLMTDVVMPEMNGRDLARNLLSFYPNLKSLFMSGYTADVIAHHGVLDEGVHFLQKPFVMQDLASKVREALDGKRSGR